MALLEHPHWEVLSPQLLDLVYRLQGLLFHSRFYLAGGTALALQVGHRRSIDLDFFSETDELDERSRMAILQALRPLGAQVIENVGGNLLVLVSEIRAGFFSYGYPLVGERIEVGQMRLASMADIGLMKCDALITRGSRKDFYDLYFISKVIPIDQLLEMGSWKYSYFRDFPMNVIESMIIFENGDRDVQPELLQPAPAWEELKQFFQSQATLLGKAWFSE